MCERIRNRLKRYFNLLDKIDFMKSLSPNPPIHLKKKNSPLSLGLLLGSGEQLEGNGITLLKVPKNAKKELVI